MNPNCTHVEGRDAATGSPILAKVFDWNAIESSYDRLVAIEDRNIGSTMQAQERGEAILNKARIASADGSMRVSPNCGQQLYDVIEINDPRAGVYGVHYRVIGLSLTYYPRRGEYSQSIALGGV